MLVWLGCVVFIDVWFFEMVYGFGLLVYVWMVNDWVEMIWLLDFGVDGVMTDWVDVLCDVFVEWGEWVSLVW